MAEYCDKIVKLRSDQCSPAELELFSYMTAEGWDPIVQHNIDGKICDFTLHNSEKGIKLAVEVDGIRTFWDTKGTIAPINKNHIDYTQNPDDPDYLSPEDRAKDLHYREHGFDVLRIQARDISETPNLVINKIKEKLLGVRYYEKILELNVEGGDRSGVARFPYYIMLRVAYADKKYDLKERREVSELIFDDEYIEYRSPLIKEIIQENYRESKLPDFIVKSLIKKSKFENISFIKHISDILSNSLHENEYKDFFMDICEIALRVASASKSSFFEKENISNPEKEIIEELCEIFETSEDFKSLKIIFCA